MWWLVSPQNPLKPVAGMAPFARRLEQARTVAAAERHIVVSNIETRLGTRYTADTLPALRRRFPRHRFVWLMGGDNLVQIRRWQRWPEIFETVPVAVFARPASSLPALAGMAAQRFARWRIPAAQARGLGEMIPPAWVFFHSRLDLRSATRIREERHHIVLETFKENRPDVTAITALKPRPRPRRITAPGELLALILTTLEDGKAEEIVTVELAGKTTIADQMVIATGRSSRQVVALTEHLAKALAGRTRVSIEGKTQGDWVLIDASDVIVHLFRPEVRAYYNLEKMWGDGVSDGEAAQL